MNVLLKISILMIMSDLNHNLEDYLNDTTDPSAIIGIVGYMPEIGINSQIIFPSGEIILKRGNQDFGLAHIWNRHQRDFQNRYRHLSTWTLKNIMQIIADICIKNVNIYQETKRTKLAIIHTRKGKVVVEMMTENDKTIFYSVVTTFLFSHNQQQNPVDRYGQAIGKIQQSIPIKD